MAAGRCSPTKTNENGARGCKAIADDLDCTLAQLSLAWCTKNPHVSTVITGASRVAQVRENIVALEVMDRLDADVMERIEDAVRGPSLARGASMRLRARPGHAADPISAGASGGRVSVRVEREAERARDGRAAHVRLVAADDTRW